MDITTIQKLFQFGWKLYSTVEETVKSITPEQLDKIKQLYAAFHGLSSLSDVSTHLNEPRFCSLPDTMPIGTSMCKWPTNDITYDIVAVPNPFSKQDYVAIAAEAFKRWSDVCGIKPQYTPGNPSARIIMGVRSIDGQFGVLAESELPCGGVQQCHQWFDTGEQWAAFDTGSGANPNIIDILRVMTHELGHALGMNHIGAGNLLAPTYSKNVIKPQAGDIQEMQARYGAPTPSVPPPVGPTPTIPADYILRFQQGKLSVDGYRLTKLAG